MLLVKFTIEEGRVGNAHPTKDLEQKSITYARNGTAEYWVIDLKNNKLIVHTLPKSDRYSQIVEHKTGTISLAVSQISIDLDRLLLY